ncbi:mas-related G-protein coupled receptor member X4-like [Monodelphis domestica]|uniref:mas-related G-protein coupled receptor member X4-like n=1 Tax=Monodelphis domestica TaxID=13616 RepID=UPI00044332DC|nr:mas-related G-protein coupled receptor member X4-like [Monodelphis domestica]
MAESPTPEQLESVLDTRVEEGTNWSLDPWAEAAGEFVFLHWMEILTLVIALVGLVGNSIILWLLGFCTQRSPFSAYILILATSDTLFLGSCFGLGRCLLGLPYCVGLSLLAAISTERCLSVLFPLWMVLLTPVLCVSSLTLVLRVQCSSQRRRPPRLYLLVLLTVLMFLLCGLPLGVINSVWFFSGSSLMPYWLFRLLACVSSSANPFIYFFLGNQWRRRGREPLSVVLQRALGEEQVAGYEGRDTSHPNSVDKNKILIQGNP